ncbi:MAG: radical SAM protein [Phycisphaerae bacterium]|nr:radical SAM protein [Phycisphaerae bacterium]
MNHGHAQSVPAGDSVPRPRIIAFEVTRRCPLRCRHCRAAASTDSTDGLSTEQCKRVLKGIADFHKSIIIFTGGEPLAREDIFELIEYARSLGLRSVLATCGMDLDAATARRLKTSGVLSLSFSLDGATAASHDAFRQTPGAFDAVMSAIEAAKSAGLRFQINTTLTRLNLSEVGAIADLAVRVGAACFNPFILVPVGRGEAIRDLLLGPMEYEDLLGRLADLYRDSPIEVRVTCGPQFARVVRRKKIPNAEAIHGCLAATGFAFISHTGQVQTCGFLDISAGSLIEYDYDFGRLWKTSPLLVSIRKDEYRGACGDCGYRTVCRGCRARALAVMGDVLHEDPICILAQKKVSGTFFVPDPATGGSHPRMTEPLDEFQKRLLTVLQDPLPLCRRPFARLAERLGVTESQVLDETIALKSAGWIRRFRGQINYRALGRTAVLVTASVPDDKLTTVGRSVCQLSGVSHNYIRRHRFNLWFTLQGSSQADIERQLAELSGSTGMTFYSLPALRLFKLDVRFNLADSSPSAPEESENFGEHSFAEPVILTPIQKTILMAVQKELPLVEQPFDLLAGIDPATSIQTIQSLQSLGILRRISAVVDYIRLGFTANAMFAGSIHDDKILSAGLDLARYPLVSHCYHRRPFPELDCNLFAMFHARSASAIHEAVESFIARWQPAHYALLETVAELKKQPVTHDFSE